MSLKVMNFITREYNFIKILILNVQMFEIIINSLYILLFNIVF
jgi:hypothetical protein